MNWLGLASVILGFAAFAIGRTWATESFSPRATIGCWCLAVVFALPALGYSLYYLKVLAEPVILYRVRTVTGSEMLASGAGLLAAWIDIRLVPRLKLSRAGRRLLMPVVLALGLAVPYLKPLLRPLSVEGLRTSSEGGIWLQSSSSTCGPAAAATIMSWFGTNASERELARDSFTSASGTENWYLARAVRRRGFSTSFTLGSPERASLPAIAGVRLKEAANAGHFLALLGRDSDRFVLVDPLEGLMTNSFQELETRYEFTGFLLLIRPDGIQRSEAGRFPSP